MPDWNSQSGIFVFNRACERRRRGQPNLNTFLTSAARILISRHAAIRSRFWLDKLKPMTDLIFIAVIALFFVAGQLYAHWCEKL
jgi:hypothetical protein